MRAASRMGAAALAPPSATARMMSAAASSTRPASKGGSARTQACDSALQSPQLGVHAVYRTEQPSAQCCTPLELQHKLNHLPAGCRRPSGYCNGLRSWQWSVRFPVSARHAQSRGVLAGWLKTAKSGRPKAPVSDNSAWRRMGSVVLAPGSHTTEASASAAAIVG